MQHRNPALQYNYWIMKNGIERYNLIPADFQRFMAAYEGGNEYVYLGGKVLSTKFSTIIHKYEEMGESWIDKGGYVCLHGEFQQAGAFPPCGCSPVDATRSHENLIAILPIPDLSSRKMAELQSVHISTEEKLNPSIKKLGRLPASTEEEQTTKAKELEAANQLKERQINISWLKELIDKKFAKKDSTIQQDLKFWKEKLPKEDWIQILNYYDSKNSK